MGWNQGVHAMQVVEKDYPSSRTKGEWRSDWMIGRWRWWASIYTWISGVGIQYGWKWDHYLAEQWFPWSWLSADDRRWNLWPCSLPESKYWKLWPQLYLKWLLSTLCEGGLEISSIKSSCTAEDKDGSSTADCRRDWVCLRIAECWSTLSLANSLADKLWRTVASDSNR